MAYDGLVTKAVVEECNKELTSGRISKIYQPNDTDIILQVRAGGENKRLLLSANLTYPRVHLTGESLANPLEPPMFCMLLRKHCDGAIIDSIKQVGMERIIHIDMKSRNELGDYQYRRIIIEIMGRHSNILLVDVERQLILDGIHHVTPAMSRHRSVLPGRPYLAPPEQNKKNPLQVNRDEFYHSFDFNAGKWEKQLVDHYSGLSPLAAKEIVFRAGLLGAEVLWQSFAAMMTELKEESYFPQIVESNNKVYFSVIDLTHLSGKKTTFDSISSCLESFYYGKAERDAVRQRAHDLIRFVTNELAKNEKKLTKLEESRKDALEADQFRLFGELVTANLHQIHKGEETVEAVNYYEEDCPTIVIPLDPAKTPSENAQSYFRKYNKARNSLTVLKEQIDLTHTEIAYLEGLLQQLEGATIKDIEEIREELADEGYIRSRGKKDNRKKKNEKPSLEKFLSSEGIEIFLGKNNKQNEYLTHKLASSSDTWLHTKDIPGSHTVIRAKEFGRQTLHEAAQLAAYFSKARGSNQIPVDYTLIKNVKKPSGAKPGFVIYEQQKTLYLNSDEDLVRTLLKQK